MFVQHFKSMIGGRDTTRPRRKLQATTVKKIVTDRFGEQAGQHPFAILGDLNDYRETDNQGESGILDLLNWDQIEPVIERRPPDEQWTHYWAGGNAYKQLDHLLLSRSLATRSPAIPEIMRQGLPKRASLYTGPRFDGSGTIDPKHPTTAQLSWTSTLARCPRVHRRSRAPATTAQSRSLTIASRHVVTVDHDPSAHHLQFTQQRKGPSAARLAPTRERTGCRGPDIPRNGRIVGHVPGRAIAMAARSRTPGSCARS